MLESTEGREETLPATYADAKYTLLTSRHDLFRSRRRARLWTATIVCRLNLFLFSLFLVNAKVNDCLTCPSFNSLNLHSNLETWRVGGTKVRSRYFFQPTRYFKDKTCCCAKLYISGKCNKPAAHNVRQQKAKPSTTNKTPATEVFPTLFMYSQLYLRKRFSKTKQKNVRSYPFSTPHVADMQINVAL